MKMIKTVKPKELTLDSFLKELEKENEYIKRITEQEAFFMIEVGYNCSGNALN